MHYSILYTGYIPLIRKVDMMLVPEQEYCYGQYLIMYIRSKLSDRKQKKDMKKMPELLKNFYFHKTFCLS